jgi:hypothetical protein
MESERWEPRRDVRNPLFPVQRLQPHSYGRKEELKSSLIRARLLTLDCLCWTPILKDHRHGLAECPLRANS